jgi:hypothetical protein
MSHGARSHEGPDLWDTRRRFCGIAALAQSQETGEVLPAKPSLFALEQMQPTPVLAFTQGWVADRHFVRVQARPSESTAMSAHPLSTQIWFALQLADDVQLESVEQLQFASQVPEPCRVHNEKELNSAAQ